MESRRAALKIIGAIGATCAFPFGADELYGQQAGHIHHLAPAQAATGPYEPRVFSSSEMTTLSKLCDTIIPATQTPGAAAAGVEAGVFFCCACWSRESRFWIKSGVSRHSR